MDKKPLLAHSLLINGSNFTISGGTGYINSSPIGNTNPTIRSGVMQSSIFNTNLSSGDIFYITLTGNVTIANPSGGIDGKAIKWRIKQDSVGGRTVSFGNKFRIPSGATSPLGFSTATGKMDLLAAMYNAQDDKWDVISFIPGY